MGSQAAAEGEGEARGGGRGESGKRSGVQARPTLESTAPKAGSRSRDVVTLDEAPRISPRVSPKLPSSASSSLSSVITALARGTSLHSLWTRESLHLHLRCRAAGQPELLRDLAGDRAAVIGLSSHGAPAHGCPPPARLVRAIRTAST